MEDVRCRCRHWGKVRMDSRRGQSHIEVRWSWADRHIHSCRVPC